MPHGDRDLVERADHVAHRVHAVHAGLLVVAGDDLAGVVEFGADLLGQRVVGLAAERRIQRVEAQLAAVGETGDGGATDGTMITARRIGRLSALVRFSGTKR